MNPKYVVIIQCAIAHNRCSGIACTESFYNRTGTFENYGSDVKYIAFNCGGCCGKSTSTKLTHFIQNFRKSPDFNKEDVVIHLSSCMATDNSHYDRCPHIDYIKSIIAKRGFEHVVEGSYISKNAERKRGAGIYKTY